MGLAIAETWFRRCICPPGSMAENAGAPAAAINSPGCIAGGGGHRGGAEEEGEEPRSIWKEPCDSVSISEIIET